MILVVLVLGVTRDGVNYPPTSGFFLPKNIVCRSDLGKCPHLTPLQADFPLPLCVGGGGGGGKEGLLVCVGCPSLSRMLQ